LSRLLLADDLTLFEDGDVVGPVPVIPAPVSSEIPVHDGRFVGRVLTVAADGTLVWTLNRGLPISTGANQGSVLYVDASGVPTWAALKGGTEGLEEVISTDGTSDAPIYYGIPATVPDAPLEGSLWLITRRTAPAPPPPAITAKPVVTIT